MSIGEALSHLIVWAAPCGLASGGIGLRRHRNRILGVVTGVISTPRSVILASRAVRHPRGACH